MHIRIIVLCGLKCDGYNINQSFKSLFVELEESFRFFCKGRRLKTINAIKFFAKNDQSENILSDFSFRIWSHIRWQFQEV